MGFKGGEKDDNAYINNGFFADPLSHRLSNFDCILEIQPDRKKETSRGNSCFVQTQVVSSFEYLKADMGKKTTRTIVLWPWNNFTQIT